MNAMSLPTELHDYGYVLVNVFAPSHFAGNPLAVFPHADGLSDADMQAIAIQMNLAETVFAFKSEDAVAKLRIFTPDYELPFAGHPVIGAARVLDQLKRLPAEFTVQTEAGITELKRDKMRYTFTRNQGECSEVVSSEVPALLTALGLDDLSVSSAPCWVNTGSEQLLLEVSQTEVLSHIKPDAAQLSAWFAKQGKRAAVYLWHEKNRYVRVRFFSAVGNVLTEDIGTGSACANLGGWCLAHGLNDVNWLIQQGDYLRRPNRLHLQTSAEGLIYVGGETIVVGHGSLSVPHSVKEHEPC